MEKSKVLGAYLATISSKIILQSQMPQLYLSFCTPDSSFTSTVLNA
jgi:hypothetical protein